MKVVVQRVKKANVVVDGVTIGEIGKGYLLLVGISENDQMSNIHKVAEKIDKLRIFEDENHKLNKSLDDVGGEVLVISSFSLYGDALTGNRPSFTKSLNYIDALPIYGAFTVDMSNLVKTKTGQFGADMLIEAINDGPLSIIIDL